MKTALVMGAGGFVGGHLVKRLKSEGYWVRGVDLKYPEYSPTQADEFLIRDLRLSDNVEAVMRIEYYNGSQVPVNFSFTASPFVHKKGFDEVYQLAADMGGAGFVFTGEHDADILSNSALINLNVCTWSLKYKPGKIFYSSSACIYPEHLQNDYHNSGLRESDAYPAAPDSEYGWEKLFSERLYFAYAKNYGLNVRVARFHNIYGPEGTYKGGREKAPAAICRKVIEEIKCLERELPRGLTFTIGDGPSIQIWGTGHQTRSFLFIGDCIDAVRLFMESYFQGPLNIGSEEMVTINQLAELAIGFSGQAIKIKHIDGPLGVMGRNSNNDLIREKLNWEPKIKLKDGLKKTYDWIASQISNDRQS